MLALYNANTVVMHKIPRPDDNYSLWSKLPESEICRPPKFPAAEAASYVPIQYPKACHRIAPAVTENRSAHLLAPAPPPPTIHSHEMMQPPVSNVNPPVHTRQAVQAYAAPSVQSDRSTASKASVSALIKDARRIAEDGVPESVAVEEFKELKI
ncbi:hypothetical protein Nepgr_013108 [Nepenthes gracilis]|uniref:Uncharacterized protein n=1 Tax=Nepenthes gracilis TaxID=150966 RepID=A0AAD3SIH8_NEPGR|nr:hypothetical protein Nepgr_013108 [Nepenthes gracilis]